MIMNIIIYVLIKKMIQLLGSDASIQNVRQMPNARTAYASVMKAITLYLTPISLRLIVSVMIATVVGHAALPTARILPIKIIRDLFAPKALSVIIVCLIIIRMIQLCWMNRLTSAYIRTNNVQRIIRFCTVHGWVLHLRVVIPIQLQNVISIVQMTSLVSLSVNANQGFMAPFATKLTNAHSNISEYVQMVLFVWKILIIRNVFVRQEAISQKSQALMSVYPARILAHVYILRAVSLCARKMRFVRMAHVFHAVSLSSRA